MFVLVMIYFTSKKRARVEPGTKRRQLLFGLEDLISHLVETFDGRDRHVLSSLLVFLRS